MPAQQSTKPPSNVLVLMLWAMPGVAACSDYNIHGKGSGRGSAGEAPTPDIELDRERVDFGVGGLRGGPEGPAIQHAIDACERYLRQVKARSQGLKELRCAGPPCSGSP